MNCPHCKYLLFGLSEPRCPECGRPFEATDFAFPPGAVHFLCPHCRQPYFGNDEFGLPRPRTFQCIKCARHVAASTMIVHPVRADVAGEALRYGNAWEHREQIGMGRAFVESAREIALRPKEFFRLAYGTDRGGAISFGIGCGYLAALALNLAMSLLSVMIGGGVPHPLSYFRPGVFFLIFVLVPILAIIGIYGYAVLAQLTLAVLGARYAEFDETIQTVSYAGAVLPAMVVPFIGLPWMAAVVCVGLEQFHGVSRKKALVAAVFPMFVFIGLSIGTGVYLAM